jgi:hypothetical protein
MKERLLFGRRICVSGCVIDESLFLLETHIFLLSGFFDVLLCCSLHDDGDDDDGDNDHWAFSQFRLSATVNRIVGMLWLLCSLASCFVRAFGLVVCLASVVQLSL